MLTHGVKFEILVRGYSVANEFHPHLANSKRNILELDLANQYEDNGNQESSEKKKKRKRRKHRKVTKEQSDDQESEEVKEV